MNLVSTDNKEESFDFEKEIYRRLLEDKEINRYIKSKISPIIPFPLVYKRLGVLYHYPKEKSFLVLKKLEKRSFIKFISFHGIRILS